MKTAVAKLTLSSGKVFVIVTDNVLHNQAVFS